MAALEPGTEIDGFRLEAKMPSGGMASLWRASHPDFPHPVVLKVPFLDPGEDSSVIIGYEVETMILKRLSGPHVPRYCGSGDLARIPYIAMEFVEGTSLASLTGEPQPAEEVARIGGLVARALGAIHRQGVAHLDLKPENVILAGRGAVLLDFGLARHAELPDLLGEESSVPMGTPAYIAPEQVLGERSDPASDIFALGAILYQLATGIEPFGRPATTAGMKRRLYHAPEDPRSVNASVPHWLETVILNCLEVDRSRRYADASSVLFDLTNPDQVVLRRGKPASRGFLERLTAWFRKVDERALTGQRAVKHRVVAPSVILAAVDLAHGSDALAEEVRGEAMRLLSYRPDSRLACVSVIKTEIIRETPDRDAEGRSTYVSRLVLLKDWARPIGLSDDRLSYHVVEAVSPADALLRYAERNDVGHIVLGARASSAMRRHLGSVSTQVVAEALCSVSVVRIKQVEVQARADVPA